MPVHHRVSQGECLASIASAHGLHWRTIYNHPLNAELRSKRPNPNLLYPGDEIVIPDPEQKEVDRSTDGRHQFVATSLTTRLRIKLQDRDGQPYTRARYVLTIAGNDKEGATDGNGMIEETIRADVTCATLRAWLRLSPDDPEEEFFWSLAPGSLDPVDTITGVQARLNNLSFFCGAVDNIVGPRTKAALRNFQSSAHLRVTGAIDDATRSKLRTLHDGEG
jgi:N-acetylmuramoyl-L-alanine amidase